MRVVIPYVAGMLHPQVCDAVCAARVPWELAELDPGHDGGYAELITTIWTDRETVIICEQDTVPPPGALHGMAACPALWCAVPHSVGGAPTLDTLGCTKLAGALMSAERELADWHLGPWGPHLDWTPWRQVAVRLTSALYDAGYHPHPHPGRTTHLNPLLEGTGT